MVAMSPSYFSHVFHAVIGTPLRNCLRDIQLKRAHELLMSPTLSLTTIAVDAGFYDLPHFDKAFRQRLGIAPQEFRRRHGRRRNQNETDPGRRAGHARRPRGRGIPGT